MRFVADMQNMIGALGLAFAGGFGWKAGGWLFGKIQSVLKL